MKVESTMVEQLLTHSFQLGLSHIPSALSMLDYIDVLFTDKFVTPSDFIVIGKPFGAQAYYLVWEKLRYIPTAVGLNVGVKHDEIDFVDYAEETIGNALGVAAGIALTTKDRVWVNITDASLQMGNVLEAIQFIGHHQLSNIFVTVDYNNAQVTGNTSDILSVEPVMNMMYNYGWNVLHAKGHSRQSLATTFSNVTATQPNVVFCHTTKGGMIPSMARNIQKWHYKKIDSCQELIQLIQEYHNENNVT